MIANIKKYDFNSSLKNLIDCIKLCINMSIQDKKKFDEEKTLIRRESKRCLFHIELQCGMGLPLPEFSPYCRLSAQLLYDACTALLNVRTLERIYDLSENPLLSSDAAAAIEVCTILNKTSFSKDTPEEKEQLATACINGLRCCAETSDNKKTTLPSFKGLMIKDVNEEYLRFFSFCLQFTQCSLLFPL